MSTQSRKDSHIDICLKSAVDQEAHFFDRFRFEHNALPELNFDDVDTTAELFGKKITAPLVITSMTGGTENTKEINRNLAFAAEKHGIPMGLGSQRVMIEKPETAETFKVREIAPNIIIFANLGAVQLNYGFGLDECKKLIDSVDADALCLHLNPLQEAIQPEGNRNFSGLLKKIEKLVKSLDVPVIIKEVGAGLSSKNVKQLAEIGVKLIDIAGVGGTSWAYIEGKRNQNSNNLGEIFADWGNPTPIVIKQCSNINGLDLIAGGGIRSGLDIAKAICLGAKYASMGLPFLKSATKSKESAANLLGEVINQLKIAMFASGSANLAELKEQKLYNK